MTALSLPIAVLALFLTTGWLVGLGVYPLAALAFRRWPRLARLSPVVAAVPLLAAVLVAVAGVLPGDPHLGHVLGCHCGHSMPGWLHLCPIHPERAAGVAPVALLAVGVLLPARLRAWRALFSEPLGHGTDAAHAPVLLDLEVRTALVIGWLRPTLVVDRTLWDALQPSEREAVLAHERAHLVRRDPLVRAVLLALVSIGPTAAGRALVRAWLDRAELRADALAAREVGALALAETLVRCARLGARSSPFALAWMAGSLERRVEQLVGPTPASSAAPDVSGVDVGVLALLTCGALLSLPWLHHQVEHLLNLSL